MRINTEVAWNVPQEYGITEERLLGKGHQAWILYVSDHFWVLDIDGYLEFYYHPEHGLGKIEKASIPAVVFERLKQQCVMFDSRGNRYKPGGELVHEHEAAKPIDNCVDFGKFRARFDIGNWFYAQGYNYVTTNNRFYEICYPYDQYGREWHLWDMKLWDMTRMTCSTKTHHELRTLWDLECFQGIKHVSIVLKPFNEEKWNSELWKSQFLDYSKTEMNEEDRSVIRFMRQEVFFHTVYLARQGWYCTEQGKQLQLPDPTPMMQNTRLYAKKIDIPHKPHMNTEITVENYDCLAAAYEKKCQGYRVAVLNMANRQNPGGGVYSGAGAQEENLFRRTNLFQSLYLFAPYAEDYGITPSAQGYPLDRNYGGIYSPSVTVFRGLEKDGYPLLDAPFSVDVISVAGMNRPQLNHEGMIADNLVEGVKNKMRTIFDIALLNGNDCLILGALGCGAFRNPPKHISRLFHELLLTEYKHVFQSVVFAILDDHNAHKEHNLEGNFQPFWNEFHGNA